MGIPKYFRYISQRWPTISQLVNDGVIPEFDNLYLDMNAILHTCTHKDPGADVTGQLTEREMFVAIFNYINHLFQVISPKKVLYMAIDGVAPRAKMNQQRSRRFRSALDQEKARKEAVQKGVELPKEDPFDSNCITPGTEFMAKLTKQLKYFISRKISEDSKWQDCRIILSGHEVPGEGEHKIMNFVRSLRAEADFDPNTRHCLYGLDADLIMLGLSTHEPHFALLREEVTFGRKLQFQSSELSEKRFFLLHLSLVREYLELELMDGLEEVENVDFERMLDDFILINFFIGNDFLPELPMLLVNDGAIPVILSTYKDFISQSKGSYITKDGRIDFQNLRKWMIELSSYQTEKFEEESRDALWFNNQLDLISTQSNNDEHTQDLILTPEQKDLVRTIKHSLAHADDDGADVKLPDDLSQQNRRFVQLIAEQTGFEPESAFSGHWIWLNRLANRDIMHIIRVYEKAPEADEHRQELYDLKFRQWRDKYYSRKFNANATSEIVVDAATNYLEGLQWVLGYYYHGCPSWSWYYHGHYAPMTTELINGITPEFKVTFPDSTPFTAYEQLMAVLPDRSSKLLPPALRDLVLESTSPIIDFYPHEFQVDKNGKKADWEAVVLIPFIDEKRLLDAVHPRVKLLSDEEQARNAPGTDLEFLYDPQTTTYYKSPTEGLADIDQNHCLIRVLEKSNLPLRFGRLEKSRQGVQLLSGFPSLKVLPYAWSIEKAGVRVFERESQSDSVILKINAPPKESIEDLASRLVGESVYVEYPFLREARVIEVFDRETAPRDVWTKQLPAITRQYSDHGVDIGRTQFVVQYAYLKGLVKHRDGAYKKEFGPVAGAFPLQMIVDDVEDEDERFKEREAVPVAEEFPLESHAVVLLNKYYGGFATVKGYTPSGNVNVEVLHAIDPVDNYGSSLKNKEKTQIRWRSLVEAARSLRVDVPFLSMITSRFMFNVAGSKVDLGIGLRRPQQNLMAEGYARVDQRGGWEFSDKGIATILAFLKDFRELLMPLLHFKYRSGPPPDLFTVIGATNDKREEISNRVASLRIWRKENLANLAMVPTSTAHFAPETVRLVEKRALEREGSKVKVARVAIDGIPRDALLSPSTAVHQLRRQSFELGDRVLSALNYGSVPIYSIGTVVGLNGVTAGGMASGTVDVVWDKLFDAGSTLDGRIDSKRGLIVPVSSVVNLSKPQLVYYFDGERPRMQHAESLRSGTHKKSTPFEKDRSNIARSRTSVPAPKRNDWATSQVATVSSAAGTASRGGSKPNTFAQTAPKHKQTNEPVRPKGPKAKELKPSEVRAKEPKAKAPRKPKAEKSNNSTGPKHAPSAGSTQDESAQLLSLLRGASITEAKPAPKEAKPAPKEAKSALKEAKPAPKEPKPPLKVEPKEIPQLSETKRPSSAAAAIFGAAIGRI